jgi:Tol biopolymer transport system component
MTITGRFERILVLGAIAVLGAVLLAADALAKKDRTSLVSRQSASAGGGGGDDFADDPAVSASGRYVAFETGADNLGGPAEDVTNIYLYDRERDKVKLVSRRSKNAGGAAGDGFSNDPSISGNGRYVAFETESTNLGGPLNTLAGDDNVYVYDLQRNRLELVSRASNGAGADDVSRTSSEGGGAISRSGRYVVFQSFADNLGGPIDTSVDNIYVYDRKRDKVKLASRRSKGAGGAGANGDSEGQVISANGRIVAFDTESTNLGGPLNNVPGDANVYVYDLNRKKAQLVSRRSNGGVGADGFSEQASISAKGRFVAFETEGTNLGGPLNNVAGDDNVYVYDRDRKKVELVSRQSKPAGNQGADGISQTAAISGNGRFVVFETEATNLGGPLGNLAGDDNIYIRDRG